MNKRAMNQSQGPATSRARHLARLTLALGAVLGASVVCAGQTVAAPATVPVNSRGVSYQNGRLTIHTEGSTLAEVLRSVAEKIGAVIEVPPGSGGERVIEHAGPGLADEVLTSLLSGSEFNFIIVTSPATPHNPTRVLLTAREGGTSMPAPEVASANPGTSTDPQLYGGGFTPNPDEQPEPTQAAVAAPVIPGSGEQLSPEVLDQMMKERIRLRHAQQDAQAQASGQSQ